MYQAWWCAEVARTNQSRNALSTEKQPIGVHVLEKQNVCGVWCEAKELDREQPAHARRMVLAAVPRAVEDSLEGSRFWLALRCSSA